MKQHQKPCKKTKKIIHRPKSKILNELKPVKNTDKNKQHSMQKEVPPSYKLQDAYLFIYLFFIYS